MKVIRVRLDHDGFNGLIRKGRDRVCIPLPPPGTGESPCTDTARRQIFANRRRAFLRNPTP